MSLPPSLLRACLTALAFFSLTETAEAGFEFRKLPGDRCPTGARPVTLTQARAHRAEICRSLGQWDVVRLANGASMDGPGYECRQRPGDSRELGHVLCALPDGGSRPDRWVDDGTDDRSDRSDDRRDRSDDRRDRPLDRPGASNGRCARAVQGRIAWDYRGQRRWAPRNVAELCGNVTTDAPARCFERVMHGGLSWGRGTRWKWKNALDLCAGTTDANRTIRCFERHRDRSGWEAAIARCHGPGRDGFTPEDMLTDDWRDREHRGDDRDDRRDRDHRRDEERRNDEGYGRGDYDRDDGRGRGRRRLRSGRVVLQSDNGLYLGRCRGCQRTRGRNPDTAAVHVDNPRAPYAIFSLRTHRDGTISLRSDTGKYLGRCRGCVPGAPTDTVTVHVGAGGRPPAFARFRPVHLGGRRWALKADTGKYVARCRNCSPRATTRDVVTIHATNPNAPYAQWRIVYVD